MVQPEHVVENRRHWNDHAHEWVERGELSWSATEPFWGAWSIPQAEVPLLPDDLVGLRAIELGCGTGYVAAWMTRRGATVMAVDTSRRQLETAARLAAQHRTPIGLVEASAEVLPASDSSFDFAISEYGAAIWCDPYVWIHEAARVLRPGGRLVFLGNHPLAMACIPPDGSSATPELRRDLFGMHRLDWRDDEEDPGGIEFNLMVSEWLRLFEDVGFAVDGYLELRPPPDADDRFSVPATWARRWPAEHAWFLRRR